jgi:hypothetical protein
MDVSLFENFSSMLDGWANRNVGRQTTYDITGLATSTTYYVRLRAIDHVGIFSNYSNTASATTLDSEAPNPPTGLSSIAGPAQIKLSWSPSSVSLTSYQLDVSLTQDFSTFVENWESRNIGMVSDILISGLMPGTRYFLRLRAMDNAGNVSENSEVVSSRTLELPGQSLDTARVWPNPYRFDDKAGGIKFDRLPPNATLHFYSTTGKTIHKLEADNAGYAFWNLTNQAGSPVASGLYMVALQHANQMRLIRIAVIR